MKNFLISLIVSNIFLVASESTHEIKKKIIEKSISSYSGNCPCPYNIAKNGSSCGGRSAYSRTGGKEVICYQSDITQEMIENYTKWYKF